IVISGSRSSSGSSPPAHTFADADTTPSVAGLAVFYGAPTAVSITNFVDSFHGKEFVVIGGAAGTTLVQGTQIQTHTGSNIVLAEGDVAFVRTVCNPGSPWAPRHKVYAVVPA